MSILDVLDAMKNAIAKKADEAKNAIAKKSDEVQNSAGKKFDNFLESQAQKKSDELKTAQKLKTPEEKQRDYDVARQSLLGEFSSSPISGCQECIANAKAQRRKKRLNLVDRAIVSCPKHASEAVRLRQDMDEVENMRCAKHVYIANDEDAPADLRKNPPPGFKEPTKKELAAMGLSDKMLKPPGSQFKAAVYMKDENVWGKNPQPPAVLAFRGSTPELEDWENNVAQGANREAPYYRRAVEIGDSLRTQGANVQIVGHSLGGGLASAAQGASGLTASTYNAAGLNSETVPKYLKEMDEAVRNAEKDKITAIRVKGEVLTKTQESWTDWHSYVAPPAVGTKRGLDPAHDRAYFEKNAKVKADPNDDYATYLHGMDEVIAATEKQKESDEKALKDCLGKRTR